MSCIVLVGGGIGCGKSTLIDYFLENKTELFNTKNYDANNSGKSDEIADYGKCDTYINIFTIQFDVVCSIQEQEKLMKTLRGLRNFRVDLLMAAERSIASICKTENSTAGPLNHRSEQLLEKLIAVNSLSSDNYSSTIFLVEDNFYYRSMRYDWFQIARRNNLGFATVFLHCPINIAVSRNSQRGYQIPEDRIKKILSFLELPDSSKFKWEKYSIMLDSSAQFTNSSLSDLMNVIKEALKNPAEIVISEEKIEAQKICSKNAVHQADKILRRIVSKNISNMKAAGIEEENLQAFVSTLVCIRQRLLCDIKQGTINLPENIIDRIQDIGIESVLDAYEETLTQIFSSTLEESAADLTYCEQITKFCILDRTIKMVQEQPDEYHAFYIVPLIS